MDAVIEFKRDVYMKALQELSRFINRPQPTGPKSTRDSSHAKLDTENMSTPSLIEPESE
jgi:putative (di)nucleoside polyphosphate hydrolase